MLNFTQWNSGYNLIQEFAFMYIICVKDISKMKVKNIYTTSPLTEAVYLFKSATPQVTADGKGSHLHAVVN